ncbi:uncharacterized protein LOC132226953 isoform X5 [Myotis daubentonii]|uniref:uncharacterized protein LOC132226953 isoform X5 n=1 Tax=Myotis daubentonii TaxID=98922 RepID=UPI0028737629|nr:uncharacterized protein LOC132226953 isoform X5 [Myotis daubentonii]
MEDNPAPTGRPLMDVTTFKSNFGITWATETYLCYEVEVREGDAWVPVEGLQGLLRNQLLWRCPEAGRTDSAVIGSLEPHIRKQSQSQGLGPPAQGQPSLQGQPVPPAVPLRRGPARGKGTRTKGPCFPGPRLGSLWPESRAPPWCSLQSLLGEPGRVLSPQEHCQLHGAQDAS